MNPHLLVGHELGLARIKHPPLKSLHEAIACIREEYLELEREIFAQVRIDENVRMEASHLAAICLRMMEDLL